MSLIQELALKKMVKLQEELVELNIDHLEKIKRDGEFYTESTSYEFMELRIRLYELEIEIIEELFRINFA